MAEELGGSEFGELEGVSDEIEDVAAKHGMFLEGLAVVGNDTTVALDATGGGTFDIFDHRSIELWDFMLMER